MVNFMTGDFPISNNLIFTKSDQSGCLLKKISVLLTKLNFYSAQVIYSYEENLAYVQWNSMQSTLVFSQ